MVVITVVEFILMYQVSLSIWRRRQKPVDSISDGIGIVLLPEWIDIDMKLILLKIAAYILREAGTDGHDPVLMGDGK